MILPDKCCAKCGFLFGTTDQPATREDFSFDPDLIRSAEDPSSSYRTATGELLLALELYFRLGYADFAPSSAPKDGTYPEPHTWQFTRSIQCYRKKWRAISWPRTSQTYTEPPEVWDEIRVKVHKDRTGCNAFFQYTPGHTPAQHIELQTEGRRIAREEKHEKTLTRLTVVAIALTVIIGGWSALEAISTFVSAMMDLGNR